MVRLDRDRAVYVSYRLGERVYWTSKKVRLFKGETVLTDGQHEARTRCGNRISKTPEDPISPKEPLHEVLEAPEAPDVLGSANPPIELPLTSPDPPTSSPVATGGGIFIPPIVPIFWGSDQPPGVLVTPPPSVPISPTPEPTTLLLLAIGGSGVWLFRKKLKP